MGAGRERVAAAFAVCPIYPILDSSTLAGRSEVEWLDAVLSGGVKIVQLRLKEAAREDVPSRAALLGAMCRDAGALSILNDRVDIALLTGCDGVHLGAADDSIVEARSGAEAWERRDFIIGTSARTPGRARELDAAGADYIGCGACFPTGTKDDAQYIGLDGLRLVRGATSLPVTGIGGLSRGNWREVLAAGANAFSAIRMWNAPPDEIGTLLAEIRAGWERGTSPR